MNFPRRGMVTPMSNPMPRYKGFNLLELFIRPTDPAWREIRPGDVRDFRETDFTWMRDWGFDFVRIPIDYRFLQSDSGVHEPTFARIDRLVELAGKYAMHLCLNLHRVPGYCVNRPPADNLWKDLQPLAEFCNLWREFARRYAGIGSDRLSFNLVNEPPRVGPTMTRNDHRRVIQSAVDAIRKIDPTRLIIADGLAHATEPSPELADAQIAQSCRGYFPMSVSHHLAHWCNVCHWPEPNWPGVNIDGQPVGQAQLEQHYQPWVELIQQGVGVHCGEAGAHNRTPHPVVLNWMRDLTNVLRDRQIGLALWNFRGSFGILDSGRPDAQYTDFHGHALDESLLQILRNA
jgi:endoglucanase